jgi:hypothetical protein
MEKVFEKVSKISCSGFNLIEKQDLFADISHEDKRKGGIDFIVNFRSRWPATLLTSKKLPELKNALNCYRKLRGNGIYTEMLT